jgi:hypothetical protein
VSLALVFVPFAVVPPVSQIVCIACASCARPQLLLPGCVPCCCSRLLPSLKEMELQNVPDLLEMGRKRKATGYDE